MIKQLQISNYQSHKDTTLALNPGVNMVVGQSDSGKSAIIRALKWLATNRPLGDSFKSWAGKGETTVCIFVGDKGKSVMISHSPSMYSMDGNGKAQEWSAIGTTVPEAVTQALNISDLSWQGQMDAPFLLSASPGEVARVLNEVADLDKIDSTLVNINRMARDNRSSLTATAQEKQRLEIDLSAYRDLDSQLERVAQLKEMARKADALDEMVFSGENLLMEVAQARERLSAMRDTAEAEAMLDGLLDMVGQLKKLDSDVDNATEQMVSVAKKQSYYEHITEELNGLEEVWHERSKGRCPLCGRGGQ